MERCGGMCRDTERCRDVKACGGRKERRKEGERKKKAREKPFLTKVSVPLPHALSQGLQAVTPTHRTRSTSQSGRKVKPGRIHWEAAGLAG